MLRTAVGKASSEHLGKSSMTYRVEEDGGHCGWKQSEHSLKHFPEGLMELLASLL